jgi:molybdopterin-binding protein
VIRGEIRSVVQVGNRVRVRIGPIAAEITVGSVERLELAPGVPAIATFKATGTRLVAGAPPGLTEDSPLGDA